VLEVFVCCCIFEYWNCFVARLTEKKLSQDDVCTSLSIGFYAKAIAPLLPGMQ